MRRPRLPRLLAVIGGLTAVIVFLHYAGRFELTGPVRWNREELQSWLEDPVVVVATAARWLALVLAYYLMVVILFLAGSNRSERLSRLVPRRWLAPLAAVLGITAVAGPLVLADRPAAVEGSAPLRIEAASPALVLERITEPRQDSGPDAAATTVAGDDEIPADTVAPPSSTPVSATSEWHVAPGESMWSIACDSLIEAWGRSVTDAEIVPYWRQLIAANSDRLIEPGNPDLILPGQLFVIPDAPPDPGRP